MMRLMELGGWVMWPLLLCSILWVAILIERLFHYHRAQINTTEFVAGIRNVIKKGNITEATSICEETPGPVAHVIKAALLKHDRPKEEIKETIADAARHEVPRLERNLVVVATIGNVAPLLGLLGTVLGMIKAFQQIQAGGGIVNANELAGGIWEALITTAAGLCIAVPVYVTYNFLVSRVGGIVLDMERGATEVVDLLTSLEKGDEI